MRMKLEYAMNLSVLSCYNFLIEYTGATIRSDCILCQAGSFQTGSGPHL
jgi:hypothetical protein